MSTMFISVFRLQCALQLWLSTLATVAKAEANLLSLTLPTSTPVVSATLAVETGPRLGSCSGVLCT